MKHVEKWIWLPEEIYKNEQNTAYSAFAPEETWNHAVAEFEREYSFGKKIAKAQLRFSADTAFQLYCNGDIVATGPACVGGDFIGNETARDNFYAFNADVFPETTGLKFFARVRMSPFHICEYSKGRGGFMLSAIVTFEDGTVGQVHTDESWLVRKNGGYIAPKRFDGRIKPDAFVQAQVVPNIWKCEDAPIPVRTEREMVPENGVIRLMPHEEKCVVMELDKIWGGFISAQAKTQGEVEVEVTCREIEEQTVPEVLIFDGEQSYRGFVMHSAGNLKVDVRNRSEHEAEIKIGFIETHYPVYEEADTTTSDGQLDQVLKTCKHTLKICRQTHHLDSTRHCEPLACTGDYYIESLMTPFSFGDMRLAEFDLLRTAVLLERENGRMFHTTYSLIWVKMLWDVYMFTGKKELLEKCEKALGLLLGRFETYIGENGLIETPPDYMFVDWIYIDEISMHHPPKALGQSCLNMFYFGALESAAKICRELGNENEAVKCTEKRTAVGKAINEWLYDSEKQCYFEGLNTPTEEGLIGKWMPQNVEKRYYLKHSNILAAYVGVCDDETGRMLVDKVMSGEIGGDCQPYFMHYLLEAVCRLGLRDKYTLKICELWKKPVEECPKGLVEGFVAPEPNYGFDHSHAWAGTPLYSLPKALTGFEVVKPGMKEISFSPSLLGLEKANVELLTPFGKVTCSLKKGKEPVVWHPEEIVVTIK